MPPPKAQPPPIAPPKQLAEAHRQLASLLHKLRGALRTLESRGADGRRKSQITLTKRRIAALEIATALLKNALASAPKEN